MLQSFHEFSKIKSRSWMELVERWCKMWKSPGTRWVLGGSFSLALPRLDLQLSWTARKKGAWNFVPPLLAANIATIYIDILLPYVAFACLKLKSSHSLMLAISLGFISLSKWAFAERCGKLPFLLAPESLEVFNSILFPYVFVPIFSPSLGIDLRHLVYWQVGIANWCRCRSGGDLSLHLIAVLSKMQHK